MAKDMITKPDFPKRGLIAFVTRAERIGPWPYGRTSFEFDGIDSDVPDDDLERSIASPDIVKPFASVRAVTTERAFRKKFGFVPVEGDWVELKIRPRIWDGETIAFHAQLTPDGYVQHSRGVLEDARLLFRRDEEPKAPRPVGAAVAPVLLKATKVVQLCQFPSSAIGPLTEARKILKGLSAVKDVQVRDVGQASFVSLRDAKGEVLGHFDAGWPISYNAHTAPGTAPAITGTAPVILSHWDWDHLHGYYQCKTLQTVQWLTPVQVMGPGASKIATQLHAKSLLIGYGGPAILTVGNATLLQCTGPARLNDNGLSLALTLASQRTALLVGDAGYGALGTWPTGKTFDYLVVTHHGADFTGTVPATTPTANRGIISVGFRNVYQHPRANAIRLHTNAGWTLERTSKHGTTARGDKILT
jgi:competence protein ComEC